MPDPIHFDPNILPESDRKSFLKSHSNLEGDSKAQRSQDWVDGVFLDINSPAEYGLPTVIEDLRSMDDSGRVRIFHGASKYAETPFIKGANRLSEIASSVEAGIQINSTTFAIVPISNYWARGGVMLEIPRGLVSMPGEHDPQNIIELTSDGAADVTEGINSLSLLDFEGKFLWPKNLETELSSENQSRIEQMNTWLTQSRERLSAPRETIQAILERLSSFFNTARMGNIPYPALQIIDPSCFKTFLKQSNFHKDILNESYQKDINAVLENSLSKICQSIDDRMINLFHVPDNVELGEEWHPQEAWWSNDREFYSKNLSENEIDSLKQVAQFLEGEIAAISSGIEAFRQTYREIYE